MSKLAHYLQEHIMGEVLDGVDVRKHFSTDASIFKVEPSVIVYPRNEQDVRKVARFSWQLAEKGRIIPITARGAGSDLTGASIGEGVVLVFPAHMNRVVGMDMKKGIVQIESGANVAKLQQTLNVQYRSVPPVPISAEYATVGGSVANNSGGVYSEKYGRMGDYVKSLRVVLANGEVIETGPLSKRELNKKMGLANFEGHVYRKLDALLADNEHVVSSYGASSSSAYNLAAVNSKDGFDLTPLFVGAQGTLGIISEIELTSEVYNPQPAAILAYVDGLDTLIELAGKIKELTPAAMEMIDNNTLKHITRIAPAALKKTLDKKSDFLLLIEFDDNSDRKLKSNLKKAKKLLDKADIDYVVGEDDTMRERVWKVRNSIGLVLTDSSTKGRVLPAIESASVTLENYAELYKATEELFKKHHLPFMAWGHIGLGQLSVMPKIDLSETSGRQKVIKLMDDYHRIVFRLGGASSTSHNAGRLRGQYQQYEIGQEAYDVMLQLKNIFDPHNVLNPGVKINVSRRKTIASMRTSYSLGHHYTHLPRI